MDLVKYMRFHQVSVGMQGRRQGGAEGAAAPPLHQKKREEREGKGREKERRKRKMKEVEPVIQRTRFHGPLVTPNPRRPPDP